MDLKFLAAIEEVKKAGLDVNEDLQKLQALPIEQGYGNTTPEIL